MFKEIPLKNLDPRGGRRSIVLGVGINDAPYATSIEVGGVKYSCPYYLRWVGMLTRCYSPRWLKAHPTYRGCAVHPAWLTFSCFKAWMIQQDWKGKQLDKDLLSREGKIYSPDTCLFVSRKVNSLFNARDNAQGDLPLGVFGRKGKYEVGCSMGSGKRTWIGAYNTIPEAIEAYTQAKIKAALLVISQEKDPKVKQAILGYLDFFTDKQNLLKTAY